MDISKYLNAAIELKGITQKSLAEKLGKTPAYINKLCKGTKNPSIEYLESILQALEMTPCEFFSCLADTPTMQLHRSEIQLVNDFRGLYDYEKDVISDMIGSLRKKHLSYSQEPPNSLPLNRSVDGYAAAGSPLFDQTDTDLISIPKKYTDPERYRIVVARGDSMLPKIHDGDVIVAKKGTNAPQGQPALILLESVNPEGEYAIKSIHIYGDRAELRSTNPSYPTMVYPVPSIISAEEIVEIIHR